MFDFLNKYTMLLEVGAKYLDIILLPAIIILLIVWFKKYIENIFKQILSRLEGGAELSAGFDGITLGKIENSIEEQSKRIDQITASTEKTLQSLSSLVIADPLKVSLYESFINKRLEDDKVIIIGCQAYTEQRILCSIVAQLINRESAKCGIQLNQVIPKYDFGGAGLNFIALSRGDIDIYPAYTWQGFEMAFATVLANSSDELMQLTPFEALKKLNVIYETLPSPQKWMCHTGFENNWGVIMRRKDASRFGIKNISDIEKSGYEFSFGCDHDFFARPNGYSLLKNPAPSGYGIRFKELDILRHNEIYASLKSGNVDMVDGFTTDPEVQMQNRFVMLQDDMNMFGRYYSSVVVRKHVLDVYPFIELALKKLEDKIPAKVMSEMIEDANEVDSLSDRVGHISRIEEISSYFLDQYIT